MQNRGKEGIAIGVKPEPDANILVLSDQLEEVVNWLNTEKLPLPSLLPWD